MLWNRPGPVPYENIEHNLLLKNVWLEINVGYTYEKRKKQ